MIALPFLKLNQLNYCLAKLNFIFFSPWNSYYLFVINDP